MATYDTGTLSDSGLMLDLTRPPAFLTLGGSSTGGFVLCRYSHVTIAPAAPAAPGTLSAPLATMAASSPPPVTAAAIARATLYQDY